MILRSSVYIGKEIVVSGLLRNFTAFFLGLFAQGSKAASEFLRVDDADNGSVALIPAEEDEVPQAGALT
jgi:hypothetical protein